MSTRFYATDVQWQQSAECNGASFDFTPAHEDPSRLEYARGMWCNPCPVRAECLAYALLYRMSGYWGGTDSATRKLLSYKRDRVKCPACLGKSLARTEDGHEVCLRCGVSWRGAPAPQEDGVPG